MTEALSATQKLRNHIVLYADRVTCLGGNKSFGVAVLLGVLATLSFPPLHWWPVLYFVIPTFLWLLAGASHFRTAFALGWWFGLGMFGASLYWVGNALLVSPGEYGWLLPLAVFGLPSGLAIYSGLASLIAWCGSSHLQRGLLFAAGWVLTEWLRGHLFTGFPWNLIGYSWVRSEELIQVAAVVGIYGVSLILVFSAVLPAILADQPSSRDFVILIFCVALPVTVWAGGAVRLNQAPDMGADMVKDVGIRIVQPSIPQREKWLPNLRQRNLQLFLDMSSIDRPSWITHIIWPEMAATFYIEENTALRHAMSTVIPPDGLLLSGGLRRRTEPLILWNSLLVLDSSGAVIESYEKTHLVPFGEYNPLRNLLPMNKIVYGQLGYSPGEGIKTLRLPGIPPVSAFICYEVIFSGHVLDRSDSPAWLLNISNDGWYGETSGPYQHLAMAKTRAVEEGLPLVRATNTGISTVIDPYGRTIHSLALNVEGFIDSRLPEAIDGETIFAQGGDKVVFILLIGMFVFVLLRKKS